MYYIMNKDAIVAAFTGRRKEEFSDDVSFDMVEVMGRLPIGFEDINLWLEGRKASKHNAHLKAVMRQMGCEDNEGFIRLTHAATINDTFWIKAENEETVWNEVSLYINQFTESISRLAFEGVGLYDTIFSSTSPELACDGSFRKCFRKENRKGEFGSDIYLYKRGGEVGAGLEPYCEQMASEIAHFISPDNAVIYELVTLHGKSASKCNLFTNEQYGYASFAKAVPHKSYDLQKVFEYFSNISSEQSFREMLVIDALCFNQDRHAGNYGIIFNNDTLEIVKMAPVFDLNLSLFPYVYMDEFDAIGDKLLEYAPRLGEDFTRIGQMGLNGVLRERVKNMQDFSFAFEGNDTFSRERVRKIEQIVRRQAQALLSDSKLYTRDVFISKKAEEMQRQSDYVKQADQQLQGFMNIIDKMDWGEIMISMCSSSDTVQCYVEYESYIMIIDFLQQEIRIDNNAKKVMIHELQQLNEEFWSVCQRVLDLLKSYIEQYGATYAKWRIE